MTGVDLKSVKLGLVVNGLAADIEALVFDRLYEEFDRLVAAGLDPDRFGPGDTAYEVRQAVVAALVEKFQEAGGV